MVLDEIGQQTCYRWNRVIVLDGYEIVTVAKFSKIMLAHAEMLLN